MVEVATGVIGVYFLGFGEVVGVGATSAENICVETLMDVAGRAGAAAAWRPHAVKSIPNPKTRASRFFITAKYSGSKLSRDEFL